MAELTVVVPVRDDPRIATCLATIDNDRARTLVVLNSPTQEVRDLVATLDADVVEVTGVGGPGACEYGLQHAPTRHVLFMDSDCVFTPGTVTRFVDAIGTAPFVKGRVLFGHRNRWQRAVAITRTVHTSGPSMLFKVPLMVDRTVLDLLDGFLFDRRLSWTEDLHLTARVRRLGIGVRRIPDAVVLHRPLGPRADLRAAFRYGVGHAEGVRLGLAGYGDRPRVQAWRTYRGLRSRHGREIATYGLLWKAAFCAGYEKERRWQRR
jgi:Glycosyltransferase like family 2